jgi:hypothetical protein
MGLHPGRAPTVLTAVGATEIGSSPGVAISGSRKAGPSGLAFARQVGRAVARAGEVVVCGLAAGIDREALEGVLEAGGRAIGVAAEGLFQSRWVRRPEVAKGRLLVVSEFAPEDRWSAGRAMARNRTIAGFSRALVVADCVASGGTTDQLDVHRNAGLPVYLRGLLDQVDGFLLGKRYLVLDRDPVFTNSRTGYSDPRSRPTGPTRSNVDNDSVASSTSTRGPHEIAVPKPSALLDHVHHRPRLQHARIAVLLRGQKWDMTASMSMADLPRWSPWHLSAPPLDSAPAWRDRTPAGCHRAGPAGTRGSVGATARRR